MIATLSQSHRDLRELSDAYNVRLRRAEEAQDREVRALSSRASDAQRGQREARSWYEGELRRLSALLEEERRATGAERSHAQSLQSRLARLQEERRRIHEVAENGAYDSARSEVDRLLQTNQQLRDLLATREAELQARAWQQRSMQEELDRREAELRRLHEQLHRQQDLSAQQLPSYLSDRPHDGFARTGGRGLAPPPHFASQGCEGGFGAVGGAFGAGPDPRRDHSPRALEGPRRVQEGICGGFGSSGSGGFGSFGAGDGSPAFGAFGGGGGFGEAAFEPEGSRRTSSSKTKKSSSRHSEGDVGALDGGSGAFGGAGYGGCGGGGFAGGFGGGGQGGGESFQRTASLENDNVYAGCGGGYGGGFGGGFGGGGGACSGNFGSGGLDVDESMNPSQWADGMGSMGKKKSKEKKSKRLAQGASKESQIKDFSKSGGGSGQGGGGRGFGQGGTGGQGMHSEALQELMAMGFDQALATEALQSAGGNRDHAVAILLSDA